MTREQGDMSSFFSHGGWECLVEVSFTQGSENEVSCLQTGKASATHIVHRYSTSILSHVYNLCILHCTDPPTIEPILIMLE